MDYEELKRQVAKAGLSLGEFSELLNMHPKTLSTYTKKAVPDHLAIIATLMAELRENKISFRTAIAKLGLRAKKPRGSSIAARPKGRKAI